jgi:hypothetical protein
VAGWWAGCPRGGTSFSGGSAGGGDGLASEGVVSAVQVAGGRLGIQPVRPTALASVMVAAKTSDQVATKVSEQNHYPSVLERLARLEGMDPGRPEKWVTTLFHRLHRFHTGAQPHTFA